MWDNLYMRLHHIPQNQPTEISRSSQKPSLDMTPSAWNYLRATEPERRARGTSWANLTARRAIVIYLKRVSNKQNKGELRNAQQVLE